MNIKLVTNQNSIWRDRFLWLFTQLLNSLGHSIVEDRYDLLIAYGDEFFCESLKSQVCFSLLSVEIEDGQIMNWKHESLYNAIVNLESYLPGVRSFNKKFDFVKYLFYLLSDQEYLVNSERDHYKRLSFKNSSKTSKEVETPTVSVFASQLDQEIKKLCEKKHLPYFKKCIWPSGNDFAVAYSHDVDIVDQNILRYWLSYVKQVVKRMAPINGFFLAIINSLVQLVRAPKEYQYHNFQFQRILAFHKKNQIKASFNIISSEFEGIDNKPYLNQFSSTLQKIIEKGHEIGLHGGFASKSYENISQLAKEKKRLEAASKKTVNSIRQHYLGFSFDQTFLYYEKLGIQIDSSIGYPDFAGFKTGMLMPYQPWSFLEERTIKVTELPLIIMDGTLMSSYYEGLSLRDAQKKIERLLSIVEDLGGVFTVNWHQRIFSEGPYRNWMKLYYFIVNLINSRKAFIATQNEIVYRFSLIQKVRIGISEKFLIIESDEAVDQLSLALSKHIKVKNKKIKIYPKGDLNIIEIGNIPEGGMLKLSIS